MPVDDSPYLGPENDDLASAIPITIVPSAQLGSTRGATTEEGERAPTCDSQAGASVWYHYTPPNTDTVRLDTTGSDFPTVLSIWLGDQHPLREIACRVAGGEGATALELPLHAGVAYRIKVEGLGGASGDLVLNAGWGPRLEQPANDDLGAATAIESVPFDFAVDTRGSTEEGDEAATVCSPSSGRGVWYRYAPSASANVRLDTSGSGFDTVLSVWAGTRHPLDELACGNNVDSSAGDLSSAIQLAARAGDTYYVKLEGSGAEAGLANLRLGMLSSGPANDQLESATVVSTLPFTDVVETGFATTQPGEVTASCVSESAHGVWYRYRATTSTSVRVDTDGSDYRTTISVWLADGQSLAGVACASAGAGPWWAGAPSVTFPAASGSSYFVKVEGVEDDAGRLTLRIAAEPVVRFVPIAWR